MPLPARDTLSFMSFKMHIPFLRWYKITAVILSIDNASSLDPCKGDSWGSGTNLTEAEIGISEKLTYRTFQFWPVIFAEWPLTE